MRNGLSILAGAVLIGVSISLACFPPTTATSRYGEDDRLAHDYAQILTGMPISRLGALGIDTAKAERLSKAALREQFMPKDKLSFDALSPAVQNCYSGPEDCTAYVVSSYTHQALILVQGGRVTWKAMTNSMVN